LTEEQRERQALLWNNEPNFGDWLAPSTLKGDEGGQMNAPRRTGDVIGSLFHGHVLRVVSEIASILGKGDDAGRYAERAAGAREAFAAEYIGADGYIPGDMQGLYVLAMAFGFVPAAVEQQVMERLVSLIHDADDHLDTGFLSVPYLLDVLWEHGHRELARTLLRQDTAPSWLYEVTMGATTIWEGWEAIAPDGTVTDLSYNHYAFGCVDDWMYRRLAGLQLVAPATGSHASSRTSRADSKRWMPRSRRPTARSPRTGSAARTVTSDST
jgi:alpha-L-rhamnosidase